MRDSHDVEKCQNPKHKEAPFVGCWGEGATESSDYRDDDHEYGEENIRQRKAGRQQ